MVTYERSQKVSPRLWVAFAAVIFASIVTVLASINLYLLEDNNSLTQAAYGASPLLRFSYDIIYISALVVVVAVCALIGYALSGNRAAVRLVSGIIALCVALAGFGGLLVRYPVNFLGLFLVFAVLTLLGFLVGQAVTSRTRQTDPRSGALLGACVSAGSILLINLIALALHTVALNPVSHPLYMQGLLGNTHLSSLLIALALELVAQLLCLLSIVFALRGNAH